MNVLARKIVERPAEVSEFAADVLAGLTAQPKARSANTTASS